MIRPSATLLIVFLALAPASARTQTVTATIDVGTARMTYADSIAASSMSISPSFQIVGSRASLSGLGSFSQVRGASTNSGRLYGTLTPLSFRAVSAEVTGSAGGSSHGNGTRTGQMMAGARLHVGGTMTGIWAGAGLGRTWDGLWRDVVQGDAGAWLALGSSAIVTSVAPTVVDDTIRYADAYVGLRHEARLWDLDASLGYRAGQQLPTLPANRNVWGGVAATWWLASHVGLVAAGGTYPVDFTQGYPGGRYLSLGARVRSAPPVIVRAMPTAHVSREVVAFSVQRVSGDTHVVRVRAPSARSVEVSGDFTLWSPVSLRPAGNGWWTATLPLKRGTREVNVRIDGGAWLVPPGTLPRSEEFGGAVGLLVVP